MGRTCKKCGQQTGPDRRLCQMCSLDKRYGNDFETASDVDDVEVLVEVGETILSNRRLIFHSPSVKLTLTVG